LLARPLAYLPLPAGTRHGSRPRRRATRRRRDTRGRHLRPHRVHARPAPPVRHREPADRRRPGQRLPALSLPPYHGAVTVKKLTRGQIAVLVITTLPMIAVGIGGAVGTYANAASVFHRKGTAAGVVAAGEEIGRAHV